MQSLEYTQEGEPFRDFCLWEYTPKVPYEKKLRSSNLLFHSFEATGADPRAFELVRAIRQGIGLSNTVWGVKRLGEKIQWEFYFYDYRRRSRERSMSRIMEVIRPFIACDIRVNELFHYFMFSLDISDELLFGARDLEEIHMYIGNPGSTVSSGICYLLTQSAMRLENFYFFFDTKREADEILAKASCSAFIDGRVDIERIVWPEMRSCKVIVVANKQQNDAVYFSGIDVDQLILFLKRMAYPRELIAFIEENRGLLDHLQYDVGYDYRMEGGDLVILKSGYYGVF
jgi:hypothetical protein